jgi:hypothetical protein
LVFKNNLVCRQADFYAAIGVKSDREKNGVAPAFILPVLFIPKAAISDPDNYRDKGRSSDLLHFFAAFPSASGEQWLFR